jgi:DNA-binding LytR/AlgR family response regulator
MKQYRVAIVEDDKDYSEFLSQCLGKYGLEKEISFSRKTYGKAESFLDDYKKACDLVFMDVELGDGFLNGMEAARKLRAVDPTVLLIFVTNMPQYAPEGYSVDALDYCLKPINYNDLSVKLDKAVRVLSQRGGIPVRIKDRNGTRIVSSSDIMYIEVMGHDLMFHTISEVITSYGGLGERENELSGNNFARCSASALVNLSYIKGLYGDEIDVGGDRIKIGRSKKKAFMEQLNTYLG